MKNSKNQLVRKTVSIIMCSALLAGGTLAYLTKTLTSTGNVITTEKLDVAFKIKDENGDWQTIDTAKNGSIFEGDKLDVNQTIEKQILIKNEGDMPFIYNLDLFASENGASNDTNQAVKVIVGNTETDLLTALTTGNTEATGMLVPGEERIVDIKFTYDNSIEFDASLSGKVIDTFDVQLIANSVEGLSYSENTDGYKTITVKNEDAAKKAVEKIVFENPEAKIESSSTSEDGKYIVYVIRVPKQTMTASLNYEDTENYDYIIIKVPVEAAEEIEKEITGNIEEVDRYHLISTETYHGFSSGKPHIAFQLKENINWNRNFMKSDYVEVNFYSEKDGKGDNLGSANSWYSEGMLNGRTSLTEGSTGKYPKKTNVITLGDIPAGYYSYTLTKGDYSKAKSVKVTVHKNGKTDETIIKNLK